MDVDFLDLLFDKTTPPPAPTGEFKPRYFYRCRECLSTFATHVKHGERTNGEYAAIGPDCPFCDSENPHYIGEISKGSRLVTRSLEVPCDGRCTGATGPNCNCSCGGANHGTGALIEVIRNQGPAFLKKQRNAKAKAEAYRALKAKVSAAWDAKYKSVTLRKRAGWISRDDFNLFLEGRYASESICKAAKLKSHAGRNRALESILKRLQEKTP